MSRGFRVPSETVEFMVQERIRGKSIKDIQLVTGLSEQCIRNYLNKDPRCSTGKGGVISRTIVIPPNREAIREQEELDNAWKNSCLVVEHVVNLIGITTNTTYTLNIGTNMAEIEFDKNKSVKIPFNKFEGLVEEFMYVANQVRPFIKKG